MPYLFVVLSGHRWFIGSGRSSSFARLLSTYLKPSARIFASLRVGQRLSKQKKDAKKTRKGNIEVIWGKMEKKMEATIVYCGYMGIMEKKMEIIVS